MQNKAKKNRTKLIIIVLAVLLAVSVALLAAVLIFKIAKPVSTDETVENNEIVAASSVDSSKQDTSSAASVRGASAPAADEKAATPASGDKISENFETEISLYKGHSYDKSPFKVLNMFPGDRARKQYRLDISYKDLVTLHFDVKNLSGDKTLAKVLYIKVAANDDVLYQGCLKDIDDIKTKLSSKKRTTESLKYNIEVSLDESVSNEYKNRGLSFDFCWWVEADENLQPSPKTGDIMRLGIFAAVALLTLSLFFLLLLTRKKRRRAYGEQ